MANLLKKKVKKEEQPTEEQISGYREKVAELHEVKRQLKVLATKEAKLKEELEKFIDKFVPKDTKGNRFFTAFDYNGNNIILERMAKKSFTLNEEKAMQFFKEKGLLKVVLKRTEPKEYFDIQEINNLLSCGDLDKKETKQIFDEKVSYATLFVKVAQEEESESEEG